MRGARTRRRGRTTKSISAIRPSCDAAGQQPDVWFEIRLPSPNTTGFPCTRLIGWTTCTCWPTIASIAGERVSVRASARCWGLTAATNSLPQCRFTITMRAPAAASPARVLQDQPRRCPVEAPRVRHRLAVRHGRVGQEGHAHALHAQHRRAAPRLAPSARCRWPSRRRHGARAAWSRPRTGRRRASGSRPCCMRPSPPGGSSVPGPGGVRKHRIALHRAGHERRLHVAESEVRTGDVAPDRGEQRREVVPAPATERERALRYRGVDQQVTRRGDGQPHGPVRRRSRRGCRAEQHGEPHKERLHQRTSCSSMTP